jgi:penicillin-binding protein 1B
LLAIVWVGFDDNRDLGVSGTASAAPIWAEFMKRATALPAYHDLQDFDAPEGITEVEIDPQTTQLAGPNCPVKRREVFITGTEPTELCEVHGGGTSQSGSWLSHLFGGGRPKSRDDSGDNAPRSANGEATPEERAGSALPGGTGGPGRPGAKGATADGGTAPADAENKKGLMHRFLGIFGGSKPDSDEPKTKPPSQ